MIKVNALGIKGIPLKTIIVWIIILFALYLWLRKPSSNLNAWQEQHYWQLGHMG